VKVAWGASTDNIGVASYDVVRNGTKVATVAATPVAATYSYIDSSVVAGTTYGYQVRAFDTSGNSSALSTPVSSVTITAVHVPLFSDGFETGTLGKWSSSAGVTIGGADVFSGAFAATALSTGAAAQATAALAASVTDVYLSTRFKIASQGATTAFLLRGRTDVGTTGASILGVYLSSTGKLSYRNDVALVSTTSATTVSPGVWHKLVVRLRINGAAGSTETYLDGVQIPELTRVENLGTAAVGKVQIGDAASAKAFDIRFDDVVADTIPIP
jgi:hypothetical protein